MSHFTDRARGLLKKMEVANGVENAERIYKEFNVIISEAKNSKKGKAELPIIVGIKESAKAILDNLK